MSTAASTQQSQPNTQSQQPSQPTQSLPQPQQQSSSAPNTSTQQPYTSASLYVGDLAPDVTEALLFEIFNAVGPVQSVRVCRDVTTRRSLGYSYVNFHRLEDAERALDTLNFKLIRNRPCRIMWSHRDPTLRKTGLGNIFVKGLHSSIDNKQLYDTFSMFGNILSCKVAQNSDRESLGYGFVHYEDESSAQAAIQRVDGKMIAGARVTVQQFKTRNERTNDDNNNSKFTNVFVKNLPINFTQQQLDELFTPYGTITSSMIATNAAEQKLASINQNNQNDESANNDESNDISDSTDDHKSSPTTTPTGKQVGIYGFVNYQSSNDAERAVNELNGRDIDGYSIYVGKAIKKQDRNKMLTEQFNSIKLEKQSKYAGVNLYVKNLSDDIDDEKLQAEFEKYGTITSAKIMRDSAGKSRGFGFVCYGSSDEATRAVTSMNGQMFQGKPLYVALAQRKDQRHEQLQVQYAQRAKMGFNQITPYGQQQSFIPQPGQATPGYPYQPGYPQPFNQRTPGYPGATMQGRQPGGFIPGQPQSYQQIPQSYPQSMMPGQQRTQLPLGQQPGMINQSQRGGLQSMRGGRGGAMMQQPQYPGQPRNGMAVQSGRPQYPLGAYPPPGQQQNTLPPQQQIRYNSNVRNQQGGPLQSQLPTQQSQHIGSDSLLPNVQSEQPPLTIKELASAPEEQRKQMIGERLFPLVKQYNSPLAGKITGMLLEMDNGELLHLLESSQSLQEKVNEALTVLEQNPTESE